MRKLKLYTTYYLVKNFIFFVLDISLVRCDLKLHSIKTLTALTSKTAKIDYFFHF